MDQSHCPNEQYVLDTAQVLNLGTKDIHLKRMKTSIWLSMIIQMMLLGLFIFTINLDVLHPISWLMNCLKIYTSFNILLKLSLLSAAIFIQGEICKINYVNGPTCHPTRFLKMKRLFSVKNLLLLVFHAATGFSIFWIYSPLLGSEYESLTRQCTAIYSNDYCLEERKLFLLLGGVWSGIYFFIIDYSFGFQFLSFPLIQQLKIYRLKVAMWGNVKRSIKDSITPLTIFIFLYYLYGGYIRRHFMSFLSVGLDSEPMDSVKVLTNIKPIFFLWLFSSIFIIALQMMKILFNVYLTEHCTFPISTSMLPQANYISLVDALKPTNAQIVQHLGYLDLFTLSTKHQERREQLFTLSHPGGHPHSWNGIYCESVNLIRKFTNDLNLALQQGSDKKPEKTLGKVEDLTAFHIHSHGIRTLASPILNDGSSQNVEDVTGFYTHSHGMRKLASPVCNDGISQKIKPPTSMVEIGFNNFQSWWNVKLGEIAKKPYFAYFFAESPDSRINHLLFQSQPVIWAVQSLAFMAIASLTEDRYGIIQRDLSDIIVALLDLKVTLEKLFKQNLIVKKTFANDPLDVQMKFRLRTAVRRSLYRLAVSFGPYIKELKLSTDAELQMNNFIAFKELL